MCFAHDIFNYVYAVGFIPASDLDKDSQILGKLLLSNEQDINLRYEDLEILLRVNKKYLISIYDLVKNAPTNPDLIWPNQIKWVQQRKLFKKDWLRVSPHRGLIYLMAEELRGVSDLPSDVKNYIDQMFKKSHRQHDGWYPNYDFSVNRYMVCKMASICVKKEIYLPLEFPCLRKYCNYLNPERIESGIHPLIYKWNDIVGGSLSSVRRKLWKNVFTKRYWFEQQWSLSSDVLEVLDKISYLLDRPKGGSADCVYAMINKDFYERCDSLMHESSNK